MNASRTLVIDWLLEEGALDEAIAYALAHSVYGIDVSPEDLDFRLSQADKIRNHLRSLGFDAFACRRVHRPVARDVRSAPRLNLSCLLKSASLKQLQASAA
jgi:hypothetical protein